MVFDLGGVLEIGDVIDRGVRPAWLAHMCEQRGWDEAELDLRFRNADLPADPPHAVLQDSYRRSFELDTETFSDFWRGFWDWYCGELNTELWHFITTQLVGRFRLAILSNSGPGARVEEEARYELSRNFDPIVYSHEIGVAKPATEAFAVLQQRLGVPYEQTCFVDDSAANLRVAERLGMTAVLHTEGETARVIQTLRRKLELLH